MIAITSGSVCVAFQGSLPDRKPKKRAKKKEDSRRLVGNLMGSRASIRPPETGYEPVRPKNKNNKKQKSNAIFVQAQTVASPREQKKREPKQIWSGGKLYVGSHFTDKSSGNGLDSFIGNRVRSLTFFLV